jgi:hypothetical protein
MIRFPAFTADAPLRRRGHDGAARRIRAHRCQRPSEPSRRMTAMHSRLLSTLASLAFAGCAASASAATTTLARQFDDAGNSALVGSDLGAALFDSDFDIANNVALYSFVVSATGVVTIASAGFGAGGADPYFTLFSGSGATATFLDSNFAQAYSTGGDFDYSATLAAGTYEIALGTFANTSFAENLATGTLGDGFTGLGEPDSLGDGGYSLTLATPDVTTPLPEPAPWMLSGLGLAGLALVTRATR